VPHYLVVSTRFFHRDAKVGSRNRACFSSCLIYKEEAANGGNQRAPFSFPIIHRCGIAFASLHPLSNQIRPLLAADEVRQPC